MMEPGEVAAAMEPVAREIAVMAADSREAVATAAQAIEGLLDIALQCRERGQLLLAARAVSHAEACIERLRGLE